MQKIVSKYALAAHLAILAVAPLLLLPLIGEAATATVVLWISAFGFIWVLMEPSRRRGEMPHDARARVAAKVVVDPLFWLSLILVVYAGIRALNGGIRLAYDAELMVWSVCPPTFDLLPGSVDGHAYFCFASVVALAIVFQGLRHALGRSARAAFALVSSVVSALAAFLFAFAVSYHYAPVMALVECSSLNATYFGTAFGIQMLCAVVAVESVVENGWMRIEPISALALIGNAIGLVIFAPSMTIFVFTIAFLLLVIVAFISGKGVFEGSSSFRFALTILMSLAAPAMYVFATDEMPWMAAKIRAFQDFALVPANFAAARDALSGIALKAWKANPWLGTGLASFPLDIRFLATAADWNVLSPLQQSSLNGWWQLLSERGVIGAGFIAVALGMLLWTYALRLVRSFGNFHFTAGHALGLLPPMALTALAFFDYSYLRPEVLMLTGAYLAFSGGAIPSHAREGGQGKEN